MTRPSPPANGPKGFEAVLALRFMATGLVAFVMALWGLLLIAPHLMAGTTLAGPVLAVIHTIALGWLTMVAVGAAYQIIPVALGVPLYSLRAATLSYWVFGLGTLGLVAGFAPFALPLMTAGGLAVWAGLALALTNLGVMLYRVQGKQLTARYLVVAAIGLAVAASLGVAILLDLRYGFSGPLLVTGPPSHASLALFGWLLPLVVGVSYKLLPMFGLIHGHSETLARWNLPLLALSAFGLAAGRLMNHALWPVFVPLLAVSGVLFSYDVGRMLKKRLRRTPDVGLRWVATGLAYVTLALAGGTWAVAGGALPVPEARYWTLLGALLFLGGFSQIVLGYLHKIVPFLHWLNRYGDGKHTGPAPRTADLLDARVSGWGLVACQIGLVVVTVALLAGHETCLYVSSAWLAASGTVVAVNLLRVLRK